MRKYGRRHLVRLDHLVLGASPEKLAARREIPAVAVAGPLSEAGQVRLSALTTKHLLGPLSPAEAYEREQLRLRRTGGIHAS